MTDFDVSPDDMLSSSGLTATAADRLLGGRVPATDTGVDDLAAFLVELGDAYPRPSMLPLEGAHIAAMLGAAAEVDAAKAEPQAETLPERRRGILLGLRTRVAAATAAGLSIFTGMAFAGVLPAPLQRAVAEAAAHVGIALPGAPAVEDDAAEAPARDDAAGDDADLEDDTRPERRERRGGSVGAGSPDDDKRHGSAPAGGSDARDDARDADEDARDADEEAAEDRRDAKEEAEDDATDREEDAVDDKEEADESAEPDEGEPETDDDDSAEDADDLEEESAEEQEDSVADDE